MTRQLAYQLLDVFTDRPFRGNQLAVFLDADGLTDNEMQTLAGELNLAESAFVHSPSEAGAADTADARLRLFTPGVELPFAGHPTIGTAWALAQLRSTSLLRLELNVGVIEASIDDRTVTLATTTPVVTERLSGEDHAQLARVLGLDPADVAWPGSTAAPAVVSCGTPYLVVPLTELALLAAVDGQRALAAVAVANAHGADLAMVAPGNAGVIADADVHVRVMSDPSLGPLEDAATGSAAVPICAFLGLLVGARGSTHRLVIEQGVEMGRPSRLETSVDFGIDGAPVAASLAGSVVPIGGGWLELP